MGPYAVPETVTKLNSPQMQDSLGLASTIIYDVAMDGTIYTYKKTKGLDERILKYSFKQVHRKKALEVEAFLKYYGSDDIRLVTHDDQVWKVKVLTDPFSFTPSGRKYIDSGGVSREGVDFNLEFQGVRIS